MNDPCFHPYCFNHVAILSLHFITHPQSKSLIENDNLTFSCSAVGIPTPSIEWMFNGSKITNHNLTNSITTGRTTTLTLTITMIGLHHAGVYYCIATNSHFTNYSIESNNATVTVQCK